VDHDIARARLHGLVEAQNQIRPNHYVGRKRRSIPILHRLV
jgi:hypothetical protein